MSDLHTKIIATIGPATLDKNIFKKLILKGVDYIRINTAYGNYQQYNQILKNLSDVENPNIQVIYDLKEKDKLEYAISKGIYKIAISFVEDAQYIKDLRKLNRNLFLISKIESELGVKNFDEILAASDGIMVARGDLGKSINLEKIPPLQKDFTCKTLKASKFLITATEMLLSMVNNIQPTRAEVSDVANAVFDNSSAVMLSEETAIGKHPVEAVDFMRRIIKEAEDWKNAHTPYQIYGQRF